MDHSKEIKEVRPAPTFEDIFFGVVGGDTNFRQEYEIEDKRTGDKEFHKAYNKAQLGDRVAEGKDEDKDKDD